MNRIFYSFKPRNRRAEGVLSVTMNKHKLSPVKSRDKGGTQCVSQ